MHANFEAHRSLTALAQPQVALTDGVTAGPFTIAEDLFRVFYLETSGNQTIQCDVVHWDGDLDLYMSWDLRIDECESDASAEDNAVSTETCVIGPNNGTAYAYIDGFYTATNYTVTCMSV